MIKNVLLDGTNVIDFIYDNFRELEDCYIVVDKDHLDILKDKFKPHKHILNNKDEIYFFNGLYDVELCTAISFTFRDNKKDKRIQVESIDWGEDKSFPNYTAPIGEAPIVDCQTRMSQNSIDEIKQSLVDMDEPFIEEDFLPR